MKTRKVAFVLIVSACMMVFAAMAAHAAAITCTVESVGPYGTNPDTSGSYIYLTAADASFTNQKCKIGGGPTKRGKEFLAAALTALASGKQVSVTLTTGATPEVTSILVLK